MKQDIQFKVYVLSQTRYREELIKIEHVVKVAVGFKNNLH